MHKFFYCNGKIKMQGLEYEGRVGIWTTYDNYGNIIEKTDYGNVKRLVKLKELKYND
jgi:antitoxin component YwqK of YwqJK toxin-antitoxin module